MSVKTHLNQSLQCVLQHQTQPETVSMLCQSHSSPILMVNVLCFHAERLLSNILGCVWEIISLQRLQHSKSLILGTLMSARRHAERGYFFLHTLQPRRTLQKYWRVCHNFIMGKRHNLIRLLCYRAWNEKNAKTELIRLLQKSQIWFHQVVMTTVVRWSWIVD